MQCTGIQCVALLPFNGCKYTAFKGEYFKNVSLKIGKKRKVVKNDKISGCVK